MVLGTIAGYAVLDADIRRFKRDEDTARVLDDDRARVYAFAMSCCGVVFASCVYNNFVYILVCTGL